MESRQSPGKWEMPSRAFQGSVFGPPLFLVYMNNLPQTTRPSVHLFADDTIVHNTRDNTTPLQEDLQHLEAWEAKWDMLFHTSKCKHINFSRNTKPPPQSHYTLQDYTESRGATPKTPEMAQTRRENTKSTSTQSFIRWTHSCTSSWAVVQCVQTACRTWNSHHHKRS